MTAQIWSKMTLSRLLFIGLLVVLMVEGLCFNHLYWRFHMGDYEQLNIPLPVHEKLNRPAHVITKDGAALSINDINRPVMTAAVTLAGADERCELRWLIKDDSSQHAPVPANTVFAVPASERVYNSLVVSNGNAHSLTLTLVNSKSGAAAVTSLVINQPPAYNFSVLRFAGMLAIVWLATVILRLRLYRMTMRTLTRRQFAAGTAFSAAICLTGAMGIFHLTSPHNVSPHLLYSFNEGNIFLQMGNKDQSLLLDFPETKDELKFHDNYTRTLDAMFKGQLHIDADIDPKLLAMDNPYDIGARAAAGAKAIWDYSYYEGKYYSYYGYTPVFAIYLPIYAVTGKVPTQALASFIALSMLIASAFWAYYAALRFFNINANVLIYFLGQSALIYGSWAYINQAFIQFYSLAVLMSLTFFNVVAALSFSLPFTASTVKRRVFLGVIALSTVLIVQARPLDLLYAMTVAAPVLWGMIMAGKTSSAAHVTYGRKEKAIDAAILLVPLGIGAVITCMVNYMRFDSIFEFGQKYCTGLENFAYNKIELNLEIIVKSIYYNLFAAYDLTRAFPFFNNQPNTIITDMGNYMFAHYPMGLFSAPVWYLLLLLPLVFTRKLVSGKNGQQVRSAGPDAGIADNSSYANSRSSLRARMFGNPLSMPARASNIYSISAVGSFRVISVLFVVLFLALSYVENLVAAFTYRYTLENAIPLSIVILCLAGMLVHWRKGMDASSKIFYWLVVLAMLKTVAVGFFLGVSFLMIEFPYVNPLGVIEMGEFFTPFSTIY